MKTIVVALGRCGTVTVDRVVTHCGNCPVYGLSSDMGRPRWCSLATKDYGVPDISQNDPPDWLVG